MGEEWIGGEEGEKRKVDEKKAEIVSRRDKSGGIKGRKNKMRKAKRMRGKGEYKECNIKGGKGVR